MGIISSLKRAFYFPVANYFRFFAAIRLLIWQPRIIVITGSSGKTTTMHLLKAYLGSNARYSEKANSAFGIPFDILGLKRTTLLPFEWPMLFLKAPFEIFTKPFIEKIYVVEADCDREGEGDFLSELLNPEITIWLSLSRSHSMNFSGNNIEKGIANEFGKFLKKTKKLAIVNADNKYIYEQAKNFENTKLVSRTNLDSYKVFSNKTEFVINNNTYSFSFILPEETFYSIQAIEYLMKYLNLKIDYKSINFIMPPGRSSLFEGIKNTTLFDSSYNASFESMNAILKLYAIYPASKKWVVLGDMLEQGKYEKEEHEKLGNLVISIRLDKIILIGPRVNEYIYPILKNKFDVETFQMPQDALKYLEENLTGGETILFKGARFLEGIIEHLLKNKKDISKLCRREKVWQDRREKWGL